MGLLVKNNEKTTGPRAHLVFGNHTTQRVVCAQSIARSVLAMFGKGLVAGATARD